MKLNERQRKWVEALRSGKYKQGGHRLSYKRAGEIRHCCLGVACEVAIENGLLLEKKEQFSIAGTTVILYIDPTGSLAHKTLTIHIRDWIGLRSIDGSGMVLNSLASLNDSGRTFEEIADVIEQNPAEYFLTTSLINE